MGGEVTGPRVTVGGLGATVAIDVVGDRAAELAGALRGAWARALTDDDPGQTITAELLTAGDGASSPSRFADHLARHDLDTLMERITQRVTLALIEQRAGELLMFHASALSDPATGRAVVLVAESHTGKTTLTSRLGAEFGYLTDETVAVDADGSILPYPKPLSLRTPGTAERREVGADDLDLVPTPTAASVARIVWLERSDDHVGPPEAHELDLFDAIVRLVPQTSSLAALDRGLHRLCALIEATGPVLEIRYAEAETLRPLFRELMGADA